VPERVKHLLNLGDSLGLRLLLPLYKLLRPIKLEVVLRNLILPPKYKSQVIELDRKHLQFT
jgi:hypothetical protein